MKRLPAFEIHEPATVAEASQALVDLDGAAVYAGGTELLLAMKELVLRYDHLIDIKSIRGLRGVAVADGGVTIGATTTHREIERSTEVRSNAPALAHTAHFVANPRVRAAGTIGGNLCFAEPHSDLATLLLCLGATCLVANATGERTIGIGDLIVGSYETSLAPDEILVSVTIPAGPATRIGGYTKFQVHERPILGIAAILDLDADRREVVDARVAVGSASPRPIRSGGAEEALRGPLADVPRTARRAAQMLADDAELIDDEIGSREYKHHLVGVLLERQLSAALDEAGILP